MRGTEKKSIDQEVSSLILTLDVTFDVEPNAPLVNKRYEQANDFAWRGVNMVSDGLLGLFTG